MTHVIAEPCVGVKDKACVSSCPVDCIWEYDETSEKLVVKDVSGNVKEIRDVNPDFDKNQLSTQLFIDPVICIDCTACVPVCPPQAIFSEEDLPEKWKNFTGINKSVFAP